MGRRRSGEMPRVVVVKPRNHARVRIGGRAYWLGKCPDGKVTRAQHAEVARLWHRFLADGKPPMLESRRPKLLQGSSSPVVITVGTLIDRFLAHAEVYYRRSDGSTTSSVDEIRLASRSPLDWGGGHLRKSPGVGVSRLCQNPETANLNFRSPRRLSPFQPRCNPQRRSGYRN